jgi:hypothetical protein
VGYKEIDWDKVQTVEQLKTVLKLIVIGFGGNSNLGIASSFFDRANEETRKRVEQICKERLGDYEAKPKEKNT